MQEIMKKKAKEILSGGKADRVLGWCAGEFFYDAEPHVFHTEEEIEKSFLYNAFSAANVSKYLVKETLAEGKIAVFLKPCDSYSFTQLLTEHRIDRNKIYVVAIPCEGFCDMEKAKRAGVKGVTGAEEEGEALLFHTIYGDKKLEKKEILLEKCLNCKSKKHITFDELLGEEGEVLESGRFDMVEQLEKMTSEERFRFWQGELSRCIRCNACRNVCPACTCEKCVFDNPASGISNIAPSDSFEEKMFHIIRAFHVAGRCTDCGECSRVCPQNIPLHLLNRKFIKDINSFYGTYQAGEAEGNRSPLVDFNYDDGEASDLVGKGEEK